jgi:hypothetical protein
MKNFFQKEGLLVPTNPLRAKGGLSQKFQFPPFSVLNTRDGLWQNRKRAWLSLGIKSEVGRDAKAFSCNDEVAKKYDYLPDIKTGTSTFDPVLCELMYNWFCPEEGQIVDPFAGGSVRGIVAGLLEYKYYGIDLRQEQIDANKIQKKRNLSEF